MLKFPDDTHQFVLSTDTSSFGICAVLEQLDESDNLKLIAFHSRKLQQAERNYMNYEREALELVDSIKRFRCCLIGRKFISYTDNSAVASLFKTKETCGRIIRWVNTLSEYDVIIKHRAGKDNVVADFLSRIDHNYINMAVGNQEPKKT
ncbi:Retrovirus-related Pol polyprotein from transposon [Smittium culicis]|uniref:Retrovirus-related Pol polyprotein from transposon n=1 Tax=Smittium culicis TaxID=133412 RepID=A0A1R1XB59_9FUNG|nr:Retrovirus-related Pol polyprotein from transposon [Smittium culicis]